MRMTRGYVAALLLVALTSAADAANLTGSASTGYGSGNTSFGGGGVSGVVLPTGGLGTTGPQGINVLTAGGSIHQLGAIANSNLPTGSFGLLATTNATANWPSDSYNYWDGSGASISYNDTVVVTSPTLAAGTPVTVTFSLQVAFASAISHTVPGGTFASNTNYSRYLIGLGGGATNSYFAAGGTYSYHLDSNANKIYETTATPGVTALGIFNGNGHLDFTLDSRVGDTINFGFSPTLNVYDEVRPYFNGSQTVATAASSLAALGFAFGATASADANLNSSFGFTSDLGGGDITLVSTFSGLTLPGTDNATYANAAAAMPIPEPAMIAMLAAIGAATVRRPGHAAGV